MPNSNPESQSAQNFRDLDDSRQLARQKRIQKIIPYLGLSGIPIGGSAVWFFLSNGQTKEAIISAVVTVGLSLLVIAGKFIKDVWNKVLNKIEIRLEQITDPFAAWIVDQLENFVTKLWWGITDDFRKKYYQSLIYNCRNYRTQGLKTKGAFKFELEKVFVPLRVSPETASKISSELIQNRDSSGGLQIWEFLAASRNQNLYRSIAIIGAPGSGKTTLLEYLTLVYAQNNQRKYYRQAPKLIPILLYLRDVAETIYSSQPSLAKLIEQQESIDKLKPRHNWFEDQLNYKRCLVMLDGLDEVANINQRQAVCSWLDKQIRDYPQAIFLLTSRPFGYENASVEEIGTVLEVKPFSLKQMQQFIHAWYLQNEIAAHLGKEDPGVIADAKSQANSLIGKITDNSSLAAMALNPLLLTMIATIHAYRGALPGRRVELYAEICDVLLGRRDDAKGISYSLTAEQNKEVLQVLALNLMERGVREFDPETEKQQENSLIAIINQELAKVTSDVLESQDFLEIIRKKSGLIIEKEQGVYQFAHKSFQEYLAAVQIKATNQEEILTEHISDPWWDETIRLYAAQSDASNLVSAALEDSSVMALKLALDCTEESLKIEPVVRQQLTEKLDKGLESSEPEVFKLAVEVKLAKRLSQLLRIDEDRAIDTSYITWAEYQYFVNELANSESSFPGKNAKQPAIIENWSDALGFCGCLSEIFNSFLVSNQVTDQKFYYRLPNRAEIANHLATEHRGLECWTFEEDIAASKGIRLVQTKTPTIFGFDVITVNDRGQEIQRKRRYAKYFTEKLGNGIDLDMVYIPGGEFVMGSPEGEGYDSEKPQHRVTMTSFFMGKYPVTQEQWRIVAALPKVNRDLRTNPSNFSGDRLPVESIDWDDAVEFCNRLSNYTSKEYRLSTEAEWEYACRAVINISEELTVEEWNEKYHQPFHFGETITTDLANYRGTDWEIQGTVYPGNYANEPKGKFREKTTTVGIFPPNTFGLYDMHGNVFEWCEDDWHDSYQDAPEDGTAWLGDLRRNRMPAKQFILRRISQNLIGRLLKRGSLSELSSKKVICGGSWGGNPNGSRSAYRDYNSLDNRVNFIGFRVVRVAPRTT